MGDAVAIDDALDELGMLSTVTKYKIEFMQALEAKFNERKAQQAKIMERLSSPEIPIQRALEVMHPGPPSSPTHDNGLNRHPGPGRNNDNGLSRLSVGPSRNTDIQHRVSNMDRNFVTSISISGQPDSFPVFARVDTGSIYSNERLQDEIVSNRTRISLRGGKVRSFSYNSSPYLTRLISSSSPYPAISYNKGPTLPPPYRALPDPQYRPIVKLTGVLTSFKQRPLKTRSRVRFSNRERDETESTDDLTKQLANIKLDLSSLSSGDPNRNGLSKDILSIENHRAGSVPDLFRSSQKSPDPVRSSIEHRSRHMSLESTETSIHSDLTSSLTHLNISRSETQ